ncbi:MAG: SAM-dependent methyltransferase [Brevibacillus sp.]|nr:SAM-dependent methyltransferase [Brevibacillus sp.]
MGRELEQIIQREIAAAGGVLPFVRFMELALYHPRHGYYMTDRPKVGKEGDFYTSPTVHPVFAETVADAIIAMLAGSRWERPALVEAGAGTGSLLASVLEQIKRAAPTLYTALQVIVIETSPYHRSLQQQALASFSGEKRWYASIEEAAEHERVDGVLLSNEWFDAFPVHLLEKSGNGWQEVGVAWDAQAACFVKRYLPQLTPAAAAYLREKEIDLAAGARMEANPAVRQVMLAIARLLREGYVITIDYGDTDEGMYHPSRHNGTLLCYRRHQVHDNPLLDPGEQDITAHVNYSDLMRWGEQAGMETVAFMSQERFLLGSGILAKLVEHTDRDPFTSDAMRRNRAILQLIDPGGMGGIFRVLIQRKGNPAAQSLPFLKESQKKDARV